MDSFHDVQDLEMHTQNVMYRGDEKDTDFADAFCGKFIDRKSISVDEIRRFFAIAPNICTMDELIESDDALQALIKAHPDAIYR